MIATEAYYDRLRDSKDPESYRRAMIDFFFAHGENVSETARTFRTSRPTALKWAQRFRKQGLWDRCQVAGQISGHPHQIRLEPFCADVVVNLSDDPQRVVNIRAIGATSLLTADFSLQAA
jgi:hypothetical protein